MSIAAGPQLHGHRSNGLKREPPSLPGALMFEREDKPRVEQQHTASQRCTVVCIVTAAMQTRSALWPRSEAHSIGHEQSLPAKRLA
jgi:hypothetical protein